MFNLIQGFFEENIENITLCACVFMPVRYDYYNDNKHICNTASYANMLEHIRARITLIVRHAYATTPCVKGLNMAQTSSLA